MTVVKGSLNNKADKVMAKHGLTYYEGIFTDSLSYHLQFFSYDEPLSTCCAVIELGNLTLFLSPSALTAAERKHLFKYDIAQRLFAHNRRQAIVTITQNQKYYVPLLKAAGFVDVSSVRNPGSGNMVTLWALAI